MYAFLVVLEDHCIICPALIIKMGARQNSKWIMPFFTNSHCRKQWCPHDEHWATEPIFLTSLWNNEVQSTVKIHSEHVCMDSIIKTKANSQVCSKKYVLYSWQIMYVIKSSCFRERHIIKNTFFLAWQILSSVFQPQFYWWSTANLYSRCAVRSFILYFLIRSQHTISCNK